MNKLVINIEYDNVLTDPIYKVEDAHNLYMRTRDRRVAENCFKDLKLDYQKQKEQENASKV